MLLNVASISQESDFKQNSEEINVLTYSITDKYHAWSQTVLHLCLTWIYIIYINKRNCLFIDRVDQCVRGSQVSTDGRKAQIAPLLSLSVCDPDPFSAGSLLSLSHFETTCSINTHCRQNHGNLTGQRESVRTSEVACVCPPVCLCLCLCAYMQPEQRLLLYRCWITRKPAADESKHLLHGEGQRA